MTKKTRIIIIIISIILFILLILLMLKNINNLSGVGTAGINLKEYNEIKIGTTNNYELFSIIDTNNEWNEDSIYEKCVEEISNTKEDHVYTYVYKIYGENSGYAIITLQADYSNGYYYNDLIVTKKEKYNLK